MVLLTMVPASPDAVPSPVPARVRYVQVHEAGDQLAAAAHRGDAGEIQRLAARYVALVCGYAADRDRIICGLFLTSLFSVLAAVERKCRMPLEARERLADELIDSLEEAPTTEALVSQFHRFLQRLAVLSASAEGPKVARIHAAMCLIRQQLTARLRLPVIARRTGFSVPGFVRAFKETNGVSFVPYVRGLRVELAKQLLADGLSVNEAAVLSGFESQPNLARAFKQLLGLTPSEYRARIVARSG